MHAETHQEDGSSSADAKLELMEAPPPGRRRSEAGSDRGPSLEEINKEIKTSSRCIKRRYRINTGKHVRYLTSDPLSSESLHPRSL